jgi:hypothetical protein
MPSGMTVCGAIPFFTSQPGDTIALTMDVLDGTDLYAVQIKRLEKAGILSPVANTNFLTGYTADGTWVPQAGPPVYYTSVGDSTAWAVNGPSGPDPYTFALTLALDTPLDTYDLEYAVAGRLNDTSRLKFYGDQHFYLTVIPEPGTFALMILGFAGVGLAAWRNAGGIFRGGYAAAGGSVKGAEWTPLVEQPMGPLQSILSRIQGSLANTLYKHSVATAFWR